MKYILICFLFLSCAQNSTKERNEGTQKLIEIMKRCSSINTEIYKSDIEDCNKEAKNKGKISKGQLDKELRECKQQASDKYETEIKKCQ
jgi:hypothetical protein